MMFFMNIFTLVLSLLVYNAESLIEWLGLRKIPNIRSGWFSDWSLIPKDTRRYLTEAYKKFPDRVYRFSSFEGQILVVPPNIFDEFKTFSDTHTSFFKAQEKTLMSQYTKVHVPELLIRTLRTNFGPQAGKFLPDVFNEAQYGLNTYFPATEDWTSVVLFPKAPDLLASVGGLMLSGAELNRNEEWIEATLGFITNLLQGAGKIRMCPRILRPLVQYLIPDIWRKKACLNTACQLAEPVIQQRLQAMKDSNYTEPNDLMQWLINANLAQGTLDRPEDKKELVHSLMMAALGAVHVSSMAFTHAVFDLVSHPEYIQPLRAEIQDVLGQREQVTKQLVSRLKKLDSFLKESQRFNPPTLVNFRRVATKEFRLSDGTVVPKGTQLSAPQYNLAMDSATVGDPEIFDGFRWYRMRQETPENERAFQFSSTNKRNLVFGLGRHVCCGRFFVSDELKILLALVIRDYDIKSKYPEKGRPKNWEIDHWVVPSVTGEILMRKATL